jgi:drug/metabolite transporter (DMT)-like permease
MTAVYSTPALLWFIAVVYAPVTDVTAIWNANAFFAYVFSVKLLNLKWSLIRMCAVCLATVGVLTIVYGDSRSTTTAAAARGVTIAKAPAPLFGDILTLVASVIYGLYQVLYTKYAALSSDLELAAEPTQYTHIPASTEQANDEEISSPLAACNEVTHALPFGLHPNFLTASIGVCTLFVLWIPLIVLHYYGIEEFSLPSNMTTFAAIAGICTTGIIFNAGFMILLGVWGPIVTSVGSLLTIVLTLISDLMLGSVGLTAGGLLGAGMIVGAFAVLAFDMFQS